MNLVNTGQTDYQDLLDTAREHFKNANYRTAESLLSQLQLMNTRNAEVEHMLGTIYYDQGKFNKAIKTFKKALDIDPGFLDSAVGLSIILNDLGRYEEGRKVFTEAQKVLEKKKFQRDPYTQDKLARKHEELAELYFQYKQYEDAIIHFNKSAELSNRKLEMKLRSIECQIKLNQNELVLQGLKSIIHEQPSFIPARLKLGLVLYKNKNFVGAIEQWEGVLLRDPQNQVAQKYLQMAQESTPTITA